MTTLLLLDLDAVFSAFRPGGGVPLPIPRLTLDSAPSTGAIPWLEGDDGKGVSESEGAPRSVVVLAVSSQVAWHYRLTFAYVRRFALRLSSLLMAPSPSALELALVPSVPRATREALRSLCEKTSDARFSIRLERVWTITDEERFAPSLISTLRCAGQFRLAPSGLPMIRLLRRTAGPGPLWSRTPPANPTLDPSDTKPPEPTWSAPLDTRARAAGAVSRPLDLPIGAPDLFEIAGHAENVYPSLFTQISSTLAAPRGVSRLSAMPAEQATLGICGERDGVEVKAGLPPLLDTLSPVVPCALGPGAITLAAKGDGVGAEEATRERATLRTLLSEHTLTALHAEGDWLPGYGIAPGWLSDDDAIAAMRPYPATYPRAVNVAFRQSGARDLKAEVEQLTSTAPPRAVWIRQGRAEAMVLLPGWAALLPPHQAGDGGLRAYARPARSSAVSDEIVLVSPVPSTGGRVRLAMHIGRRTLGSASYGGHDVAILALDTPLTEGEVDVVPIQAVRYESWPGSLAGWISPDAWSELQRLPIVLPVGTSHEPPMSKRARFQA